MNQIFQALAAVEDERQGAPPQRVVGVEYLCAIVDNTCVVPPALPLRRRIQEMRFLATAHREAVGRWPPSSANTQTALLYLPAGCGEAGFSSVNRGNALGLTVAQRGKDGRGVRRSGSSPLRTSSKTEPTCGC